MPNDMDILNKTFSTSSGKDVKDTKMLKGEAENSLSGKNSTKQDVRSCSCSASGGAPKVK